MPAVLSGRALTKGGLETAPMPVLPPVERPITKPQPHTEPLEPDPTPLTLPPGVKPGERVIPRPKA